MTRGKTRNESDILHVRHLVKALLVKSEKGPKKCLLRELHSPLPLATRRLHKYANVGQDASEYGGWRWHACIQGHFDEWDEKDFFERNG